MLEREYFHWITAKALGEMAESRKIQRIQTLINNKPVNFYAHLRHRYLRRELAEAKKLLHRIFSPQFTRAVGLHGELMFDAALGRCGFHALVRDAKSWNGRTWQRTNHNLDRIITRDQPAYGVEIKNTQNYIPHDELKTKIQLCDHLHLTPLFIMRFAPKSYVHEVIQNGGFALLFENQI